LHPTRMLNFRSISINKLIVIKYYKAWLIVFGFIAFGSQCYSQAPVISYATPQTYTVNTAIAALVPTNAGGGVPTIGYGNVTTFAGSLTHGKADGIGTLAKFYNPTGIVTDISGNMIVTDRDNSAVRKITPLGIVTTLPLVGLTDPINMFSPLGLSVDANENIFIADATHNTIWKVDPLYNIAVFAGGLQGLTNGQGRAASFNQPTGTAIDNSGNVFIADNSNNVIRKITPNGSVTTFANGLYFPYDIVLDNLGDLFVSNIGTGSIKIVSPGGTITTLAGGAAGGIADGTGTAAGFNTPNAIVFDTKGNLYVADMGNNSIRMITPSGVVTTVAGNSQEGSNDGIGRAARFNFPTGITIDAENNLYVVDSGNNLIRKITLTGYTIDKPLPAGLTFDPTTGIISGTPTAASPATDYTITAYNTGGNSSTAVNIQVVLASTLIQSVITFPKLPMNMGSDFITPAATSNNNETPITYTSSNTAVAIITAGGLIQLVGPGTTTITASQGGDANYSPAVSVSQQMIVTESQVITFPNFVAKATCDVDFPAGATSSNSTIPLTYASSNPAVATISATGLIHIVGAGTTTITISQAGNTLFNPANPVSQVLTVGLPATPAVTIAASATSVCAGMPVTFTATVANIPGTANLTYQWQVNGVNVSTNATYTSTILASTDVVNCIVTNTAPCGLAGTSNSISGIIVTPYITPSITIASSATGPVCPGTSITYSATVTNAGTNPTYQWQINGTTYGTGTPQINYVSSNNTDQVTCILINNSSPCLTSAVVQSNVITTSIISPANPAPSITISSANNGQYPGVPITFTAVSSNAGIGLAYQWQVNGVNAGTDNTDFTTNTLNNGDQVTCILIINHGCIPTLTSNAVVADIIPPPAVTLTNTFTPNGDGINDLWLIPDLGSYPNCLVTIFTRYGVQIFQSRGYSKAWDGTYKGSQLPMGTYYYLINLGDKSPVLSGWVAIVR